MAVQIFGTSKSFETKKAERYFSERRIAFQKIDLKEKGLLKGELESVISSIAKRAGDRQAAIDSLADKKTKTTLHLHILTTVKKKKNFWKIRCFWFSLLYETERLMQLSGISRKSGKTGINFFCKEDFYEKHSD